MNPQDEKDEKVLKALLARASKPRLPAGMEERLMKKVASVHQENNVVSFTSRRKLAGLWVGLSLAASLAAGIFLGTQQSFDNVMTGFDSAAGLDVELPTGLDDQDDDAMDDLT
jgi:hypothetical protein